MSATIIELANHRKAPPVAPLESADTLIAGLDPDERARALYVLRAFLEARRIILQGEKRP
jgi:hypothetical protein